MNPFHPDPPHSEWPDMIDSGKAHGLLAIVLILAIGFVVWGQVLIKPILAQIFD